MKNKKWMYLVFSFFLATLLMLKGSDFALAQDDGGMITADELQTAVFNAAPGDTIQVNGGTYFGSLDIDKPLTLIGIDWPIIDGENLGTVIDIQSPNVTISGFVIQNSGHFLDQENSGVAVEGENATIENNRFENTLFGIYLREAHGATIRGNQIASKDLDVPRRGDPIRVWFSNDVIVEDNVVTNGRDVVLWYSERLTIRNNDISNGRYGLHFMYCDDALITQNRLLDNSVGAFMMYSRRVNIVENTISGNRGPSGYAIGLKDMDDTVVIDNMFLDNRIGVHLDTSPREVDSIGVFNGNVFAYNDIGIEMLPSVRHNEFTSNSFIDNEEQVSIAGVGGLFQDNSWTVAGIGNFWSDYAGFDADADGQGDIEYKSERLFENLMQQEPSLRLFLYSPSTNAIDFAARAVPAVRPQPKVVDDRPFMTPKIPAAAPPLPPPANQTWLWATMALLGASVGLAMLPRLHRQRYQFKI